LPQLAGGGAFEARLQATHQVEVRHDPPGEVLAPGRAAVHARDDDTVDRLVGHGARELPDIAVRAAFEQAELHGVANGQIRQICGGVSAHDLTV